ncbi:MAG: 4-phosphoerythronate dehydrogenase [Paludibacteraceae bacterium]|nr:4-phosphoerythronate dehydrogenase [Paludibacteraceae bacterium]
MIVIDKYIPFFAEAVQQHWPDECVRALEPSAIDAEAVRDADVLVVRTRTQVNEALLRGSKVRLVCTATIGFDHIDTAYCAAQGIAWMSCPGCNAQAVCDYIEEVLTTHYSLLPLGNGSGVGLCMGIVGVGHVGSLVAQMAKRLGMTVLLNDPPKGIGVSLETIARECDVISFHTPLTHTGDYPTYHLCDASFLAQCKPNALIINAARGGVVDEQVLLASGREYVLDTWENEPRIDLDVLRHARLASMHIAGYSMMGKRNATQMCLDAIAHALGYAPIVLPTSFSAPGDSAVGWLSRLTEQMRTQLDGQLLDGSQSVASVFESLRKSYPLR